MEAEVQQNLQDDNISMESSWPGFSFVKVEAAEEIPVTELSPDSDTEVSTKEDVKQQFVAERYHTGPSCPETSFVKVEAGRELSVVNVPPEVETVMSDEEHGQDGDDLTVSYQQKVAYQRICHLSPDQFVKSVHKRLECESCHKSFTYRSQLLLHELVHTRNKSTHLPTRIFHLTPDQFVKSVKKRFECERCDKSFSFRSQLSLHELVHTRNKSFQCVSRNKAFHTKSQLSQHWKGRTGEKLFQCTRCKKSFAQFKIEKVCCTVTNTSPLITSNRALNLCSFISN